MLAGFTSSRFWTVLGGNHVSARFLIKNDNQIIPNVQKCQHVTSDLVLSLIQVSLIGPRRMQDKNEHVLVSAAALGVTSH